MNCIASHELTVEANDAVHVGVKHANETNEKCVKKAGFEQCKFVALGEELEAGNFAGKFDHAANDVGEALRELLLGLNFGNWVEWASLRKR